MVAIPVINRRNLIASIAAIAATGKKLFAGTTESEHDRIIAEWIERYGEPRARLLEAAILAGCKHCKKPSMVDACQVIHARDGSFYFALCDDCYPEHENTYSVCEEKSTELL
jgi:hypothetical protein